MGIVQMHVEPPPITLIKSKKKEELDKDFVKNKWHRDPASENSDPYRFRMDLFDNGDPEEFLLFIQYFNMTLEASGTLNYGAKIQYLHTLVRGESLRQFDMLPAEVGRANP